MNSQDIISKNEMNLLKNQILGLIKDVEARFKEELSYKNEDIISKFDDKVNIILENNKLMIEKVIEEKINVEKLNDIYSRSQTIDDDIITHQIRIENILKDITLMKLKYDKIINDNLVIPGYIGKGCSYKNLPELIIHLLKEKQHYEEEKTKLLKEGIEIKPKKSSKAMNEFSINKFKDNNISDMNKSLEKAQAELKLRVIEIEKVNNIYKENYEYINDKISNIIKNDEEIESKLLSLNKEISIIKSELKELDNKLSELKLIYNNINYEMFKTKKEINNLMNIDSIPKTNKKDNDKKDSDHKEPKTKKILSEISFKKNTILNNSRKNIYSRLNNLRKEQTSVSNCKEPKIKLANLEYKENISKKILILNNSIKKVESQIQASTISHQKDFIVDCNLINLKLDKNYKNADEKVYNTNISNYIHFKMPSKKRLRFFKNKSEKRKKTFDKAYFTFYKFKDSKSLDPI